MSRLSEFFKKIEPISTESIIANFDKLFSKYCFDGIRAEKAFVDLEGSITVDFVDIDDNAMRVVFAVEDDSSYALVATEGEQVIVLDLDPMRPVLRKTQTATYLDLTDSTWITKSLLVALFTAGALDKHEASRVIRGGKSVRMPIVHEKNRISLTHRQKENLVKSLMKRNERELSTNLRLTKE